MQERILGQISTARRSVASGIGEEPNMICRRRGSCRVAMPGSASSIVIMVDTSAILVTSCCASASRQAAGSKRGMNTWRPPTILTAKLDTPSVR
jgi:hypothetical protein